MALIGNCDGAGRPHPGGSPPPALPAYRPCAPLPGRPWHKALGRPGSAGVRTGQEYKHIVPAQNRRTLLIVACTRDRDGLQVSWSGAPSEFLVEAWVCQAS
ncbi:hypothetical protein GCM10018966_017950 [Streptomyces yanii]